MKHLKLPSVIVLLASYKMAAQLNNLEMDNQSEIKYAYELLPSFGNIQLQSNSIKAVYLDSTSIGVFNYGLNYTNYSMYFKNLDSNQVINSLSESLHYISFKMQYGVEIDDGWKTELTLEPNVFSNIKSPITHKDIKFSGGAVMSKSWLNHKNEKDELQFGVGYSSLFGKPQLFPVVNFSSQLSNAFLISIGFPKSSFTFNIDPKSTLTLSIFKEGFYANNSSMMLMEITDYEKNTKIEYDGWKTNLNYHMLFGQQFGGFINIGFLPKTDLRLLTNNGQVLYNYKTNQTISIGGGIKYNF
ncbi:MAG: DUF6268 family outer membrane beta-barrel protein [Gelidibacter sp.]